MFLWFVILGKFRHLNLINVLARPGIYEAFGRLESSNLSTPGSRMRFCLSQSLVGHSIRLVA